MRRGAITREAVLKAIAEHDEMGRSAFLDAYGFKEARSYVLVYEGREYDSKAIAGVAHKYDHGRPLGRDEFSGGREHAVAWLKREGFRVKRVSSPDWVRDEVIVVCDVVMKNGWRGLDAADPRVIELSDFLQRLPLHPVSERSSTFRNYNGVARKTFDIATRHPDYVGKRTKGGVTDEEVLRDFLARPVEMAEAAQRIRDGVNAETFAQAAPTDDEDLDDFSAPEGRLLLRRHVARERSKKLREKKIKSVRDGGGRLQCEVCDFDFEQTYGDRGSGYIECHHVVPLHEAGEGRTKLADLALICSNCHRMIHRKAPWPTPLELRGIVRAQAASRGETSVPAPRTNTNRTHRM